LILSPHCMESEWVKTEIAKARKLRGARPTARPASYSARGPSQPCARECFDADNGKDSAREIREYLNPGFSHWKNHDSYQEAFERRMSDRKS